MARELLESVLKDPLIANAQVDSSASDGHLLQLRFLALKNLATVFLQQDSTHYENALRCYLQAVEIDSKDSVVWNRLGTLSCSMGSLSISRWAFEQGLLCSPNNWNCMEKLLEVLIAIGDEVACLSVAKLILRHWPSHSRALHVRNTIEESEPLPFAPRGIDKLEPQHVRLKFPDKRKATNENVDEDVAFKKLNQNKALHLTEVSWVALADALLEILSPQSSEMDPQKAFSSPDIRLSIILPNSSEAVMDTVEMKGSNGENSVSGDGNIQQLSAFKEKEANIQEEQLHERRSSRLERLRSRKPGKEESNSSCGKDPTKVVIQYLEPFISGGLGGQDTIDRDRTTVSCLGNSEYYNVSAFLRETSNNYGAYHMGHLLLEEVTRQGLTYQDAFVKFLELEKLTRDGLFVPTRSICQMQSLLLLIMSHVANILALNKASAQVISDQAESSCFVDAAIVFCKLQHLCPTTPIKTQVDLIVATHDLLAEYGLCCLGEGGKGEEGTFLRFAIKHLLALDTKLKSSFNHKESMQCEEVSKNSLVNVSVEESKSDTLDIQMDCTKIDEINSEKKDVYEGIISKGISSCRVHDKDCKEVECENHGGAGTGSKLIKGESSINQLIECEDELSEDEWEELESKIDCALDQCFFCLYGLHLRSDSSYEDDLVVHKNTSRGDYQTKEQCADVFKYVLPYAKASSRTGLVKLRRVLRAIRKHFLQPPEDLLAGNPIDKFLDDPNLCEDKLSEEAGSDGFLESITKRMFPDVGGLAQYNATLLRRSEPYLEVYCNLYYFLALSEEMSATDKWPGFVLTKEGEEFVEQNAKLFKYDLMYNPLRFESWQRLGNIYDEEVDLLLNDGSKHVNVVGWRKNATLSERVETSRRRSRRCLLMSLALAKTSAQQCEIHELLALVYYDSLQNVVPFYDQRSALPLKDAAWMMFCENSMKHFKKAFTLKQDWLHAFYLGKLSEKLGYSHEIALSYYNKAIAWNTSAVDPVYRMHASRLKLLFKCGKQNLEILKVLSANSFNQSVKEAVTSILIGIDSSFLNTKERCIDANFVETKHEELLKLDTVWSMLYNDCLSALETCVEGDLKHFHKARYMLAQGLYKRGESGDIERAKDHLSFCFKSSRSSFTINMWEIDSTVKKGRRKTPGTAGNKKSLEVNLPESSRKFITCIRKYLLFYLKLLEETGDRCILERSYVALRADKRFSLCIEDLIPVAIGRYLKALIATMCHYQTTASGSVSSSDNVLERMFALFMEQGSLWPEICSLPEIEGSDMSESIIYGYLHEHIVLLEKNGKLETLEAINEKIRKRSKNPKFSDSNYAKVRKHASVAWCRSLVYNLAQITPLSCEFSNGIQVLNLTDGGMDNSQLLCIDLQPNELWSTAFEDPTHLEKIETKWSTILSKVKNIIIKKASDENLETANTLLRACYNFYRESSSVVLTSGLNFYLIPSQLVTQTPFNPSTAGIEALDLSIPRKLLLWAYVLSHGRCANISIVVKHCEEMSKSKMKRGSGMSPALSNTSPAPSFPGSGRNGSNSAGSIDVDSAHATTVGSVSLDIQKNLFASPQLHQCTSNDAERSNLIAHEGDPEGD
ncbi:Calcineurin-binding protein cabin-1 [Glycine soja]|uniref:Calcineurin-binding protein cabin-1 n=1 Tax=Glycine soja TaxID=3848 RepID=A0A0B2QED0_GLYSO|nr:Calcineurin-binding protein cabin-1 [Glycine soja]